jgi:hypothetical protein
MGFFDSFKKSFEEESRKSAERQANSNYRTVVQKESDHYSKLDSQSDGALLGMLNGIFTSDEDKVIIDRILKKRGYKKATNGTYHRV